MLSLTTSTEAMAELAAAVRQIRLDQNLTQQGLALRAGLALSTYRLFERTGQVSLAGYLNILAALGQLDRVVDAMKYTRPKFKTIAEVAKANAQQDKAVRKRGKRT